MKFVVTDFCDISKSFQENHENLFILKALLNYFWYFTYPLKGNNLSKLILLKSIKNASLGYLKCLIWSVETMNAELKAHESVAIRAKIAQSLPRRT